MASRVAVKAETILDSPSARLTAVAVSVRVGHTIAFLGDSKGNLHKVRCCLTAQIGCQVTFVCHYFEFRPSLSQAFDFTHITLTPVPAHLQHL